MKRNKLIKIIESKGAQLKRHGAEHDIYTNGTVSVPVPRHPDINEYTARDIIKKFGE